MSRRAVFSALLIVLMALLPACTKGSGGKALHLFSWAEYFPEEVLDGFAKEFGVQVHTDTFSNNEEMAAKLQAGGGGYDVVVPSTYMVQALIGQGLLQPLDLSRIPNRTHISPEFQNLPHDPSGTYTVPYMWGTMGIAYNSEFVKSAPTQWADLLDPQYKGRIVAVDDSREIIGMGLQAVGHSHNETDPAKLKAAQAWLKEMVPNIRAWDSDNPKALLASGEVWLGLVWNGDAALAMRENPAIRYVIPRDGGSRWLDTLAIPKDAPHLGVAHDFINYILRPEVAAKIGTAYPYGLPNAEGLKQLAPEIRQNQASYPPNEWLNRAEYTLDVGEAAALFDQVFMELKAGR